MYFYLNYSWCKHKKNGYINDSKGVKELSALPGMWLGVIALCSVTM